jgi:hypothetical protein
VVEAGGVQGGEGLHGGGGTAAPRHPWPGPPVGNVSLFQFNNTLGHVYDAELKNLFYIILHPRHEFHLVEKTLPSANSVYITV